MARTRVSTTVDDELLATARKAEDWATDAAMFDAALGALVRRYRDAEIADAYRVAYERHPVDEPDEWGDLVSFSDAAKKR